MSDDGWLLEDEDGAPYPGAVQEAVADRVEAETARLRELVRLLPPPKCGAYMLATSGDRLHCVFEAGHQATDDDPRHVTNVYGHYLPWTDDAEPATPSPWTPELLALYYEVKGE